MPNTAPARADHDDNSLAADWRRNLVEAGPEATQVLAALAETDAAAMAVHFYQVMMGDPRASRLLSHEQVRTRLQPAMQRWVNGLLRATPDDVEGLI